MSHPKTRRFQNLSFQRLIPNLATVMAMCVGLTSIRFALQGNFQLATSAIFIAGILDAMDGRLARLLGAESEFGAELDSLSDFVSFGVAPALVIYIFSLNHWQGIGWGTCLFFSVCMGLRLARFNISSRQPERPIWSGRFFTGVPAPAAAMVALFPLTLSLAFDWPLLQNPALSTFFVILAGFLMVSRLPTLSFKTVSIPRTLLLPVLVIFGLTIAALFSAPWETLSLITFAYLLTIPVSFVAFRKFLSSYNNPLEEEAPSEEKNPTSQK
tara:strand:- start:4385 stop:5194 length:810 start_codon:yes stop_codon:yes gene_type:complete